MPNSHAQQNPNQITSYQNLLANSKELETLPLEKLQLKLKKRGMTKLHENNYAAAAELFSLVIDSLENKNSFMSGKYYYLWALCEFRQGNYDNVLPLTALSTQILQDQHIEKNAVVLFYLENNRTFAQKAKSECDAIHAAINQPNVIEQAAKAAKDAATYNQAISTLKNRFSYEAGQYYHAWAGCTLIMRKYNDTIHLAKRSSEILMKYQDTREMQIQNDLYIYQSQLFEKYQITEEGATEHVKKFEVGLRYKLMAKQKLKLHSYLAALKLTVISKANLVAILPTDISNYTLEQTIVYLGEAETHLSNNPTRPNFNPPTSLYNTRLVSFPPTNPISCTPASSVTHTSNIVYR